MAAWRLIYADLEAFLRWCRPRPPRIGGGASCSPGRDSTSVLHDLAGEQPGRHGWSGHLRATSPMMQTLGQRGRRLIRKAIMARCEVCGNEYARSFQVTMGEQTRTFDCFECAIHLLAPTCAHCGCRVIGHGVEAEGQIYCCAACARLTGAQMAAGARPATAETGTAPAPFDDEVSPRRGRSGSEPRARVAASNPARHRNSGSNRSADDSEEVRSVEDQGDGSNAVRGTP